ncbi:DNA polymerase IV [Haloarchaeobius sp. DYHT-AS-18]|uniref:DNA polymerase IV n=1 Tax=Haloarchaeobius sp. DYHT-AS-18 TaxID=3446117 RepID=UPI003EBFCD60
MADPDDPTPTGERLPGVAPEPEDADRIVLHVDMDCFYAACERLREPEIRGEPVVVGMGYEAGDDGGAVATASYEAREYGVESAQAITTALERLPRRATADDPADTGYYRPVDLDYYSEVASEVKDILHDCADVVREVSIDEAYLDVTERTAWPVAEGFARHVKQRIEREVGVVASVGVAPNMSAAKVASDHDKPDGLVVVEPDDLRDFLDPLSIEEIHGIGPVTARKLRNTGIETAGDLAAADRAELGDRFGERGRELHDRARGIDDRPVTPRGLPKSFSRESAFGSPVTDPERKREQVRTLAEAVADRARREGALYRTIGIKAVEPPFEVNTREWSLPGPVEDESLLVDTALDLLTEFEDDEIRKVGVRVSNLEFTERQQASLDSWPGGGSRADRGDPSGSADGPAAHADDEPGTTADGNSHERATEDAVDTPRGQTSLSDF